MIPGFINQNKDKRISESSNYRIDNDGQKTNLRNLIENAFTVEEKKEKKKNYPSLKLSYHEDGTKKSETDLRKDMNVNPKHYSDYLEILKEISDEKEHYKH